MAEPTRIADRYQVHELLGRGGMASVYRVTDSASGRMLALKQLLPAINTTRSASIVALFEHEFHTLKELSHPRVIAVYDYGVDSNAPYYTMELLDGGDLLARAPVPWKELCALMFDVCSSLALLHSRRLLHRDINPRNIRCTQDGKAKLIDFGAMAAMSSGGAQVVGTPAFTPPETLHRLATDARADLFSLGATFYAALTGQLAYPARTFAELLSAWEIRPRPPSARVPEVPAALDDLILSLLSLDPALRPQSAFDVMQRLAAIADLDSQESIAVSRAYLSTPALIGREDVLDELRAAIHQAGHAHGAGVMVRGAAGGGRSRALDACAMAAMTQGALVLRATATGNPARFAVAWELLKEVLHSLPRDSIPGGFPELFESGERVELRDLGEASSDAESLQWAAVRFLLAISRVQPLVLAIDDVERIDPSSASLLAGLLEHAPEARVLVVMTAESSAAGFTLEVLSGRSRELLLRPLDRQETQRLLASLFGDVANVELLAKEIHEIAAGNARTIMDLAQHLVDRGVIHYAAGSWTLPSKLLADDLPRSAEAALLARIARMSPEARALAKTHALAFYERLSLADYRVLSPPTAAGRVDQAVSELTAEGALVYDGSQYRLANRLWRSALSSGVDPDTARELHRALVALYREQGAVFAIIHHALAAGEDALAIDTLKSSATTVTTTDHKRALEENVTKLAPSYGRIVRAAQRLGRSAREVNELRRAAIAASIASEEDCFSEHAGPWLAQLERDSGVDLWRADATNPDAGDRLTKALTAAHARHLATPEAERVYTIEEAIRRLCEFVTYSIAIAGRSIDHQRIATLPALLEPYAPLSPVINALRNNVLGAKEAYVECRPERALELWRGVLQTLETTPPADVAHLDAVRNAVRYAIAMSEALMGFDTVELHAAELEKDPYQRLSALSLRKMVRLQQGDWLGADRLRRDAEIVALQMHSPSMFHTLMAELAPYYHAGDLSGMQRTIDGLKVLAARYPGYEIYLRDAQARFERVRGDARAARLGFEECVRRTAINHAGESPCLTVWIGAHAGLTETLFDIGAHEEARRRAAEALAVCEARGVDIFAYDLKRALALCEAKLGATERGCERLDSLIRAQTERGVSGMRLGLSTEARARVAIWMGDRETFEHYAALTAREYRHGANSPLGRRYHRLMQDATRQGMQTTFQLSDFLTSAVLEEGKTSLHDVHGLVLRVMAGAQRVEERAAQALRLLCESRGASSGHLFLSESQGLTLRASQAAAGAPEGLHVLAHEYLLKQQTGTDLISDMVTGELESESPQTSATARIDGVDYELLLLRCAVGGVGRFAGVAAIAARGTQVSRLPDSVLLATLATHFVQAGDVGGAE